MLKLASPSSKHGLSSHAQQFLHHPPPNARTRTRLNGDVVVFEPSTNRFGVRTADGAPRTLFVPDPQRPRTSNIFGLSRCTVTLNTNTVGYAACNSLRNRGERPALCQHSRSATAAVSSLGTKTAPSVPQSVFERSGSELEPSGILSKPTQTTGRSKPSWSKFPQCFADRPRIWDCPSTPRGIEFV